jgi:hypothetical protein
MERHDDFAGLAFLALMALKIDLTPMPIYQVCNVADALTDV